MWLQVKRVADKVASHQGLICANDGLVKKFQYVTDELCIYLLPPI